MAYITTSEVKQIRDKLKKEFPNIKFSVTREHGMSISVSIIKSNIDFTDEVLTDGMTHSSINQYRVEQFYPKHKDLFNKILNIIKNGSDRKWYNDSDAMTDYFDTAFYFDLNVGKWDKPYELVK